MTDADETMKPQRFGNDPADIRIPIRIDPEIWIRIPDDFWLRLTPWRRFALSEHCLVYGYSQRLQLGPVRLPP